MTPEDTASILLKDRLALMAFLRSLIRDHTVAEDLFQEVCVGAIRHADSLKDDTHVLRWARRTARHRAIDHLRALKNAPLLLDEAVMDLLEREALGQVNEVGSNQGRLRALQQCLTTLTPNNRKLVELRYGEECSGRDVAKALRRKPEAVYKALSRIYKHLRLCIERKLA